MSHQAHSILISDLTILTNSSFVFELLQEGMPVCSVRSYFPFFKSMNNEQSIFHQRLYSNKGHLPSKLVSHQRSSSSKDQLPSKVSFHCQNCSIKINLPSKVVFHQRISSIQGGLPSKVIFNQSWSFIKGHLPLNLVFDQSLSSKKVCLSSGCLPLKVIFL